MICARPIPRSSRPVGFTLVELMVVVAIVAILLAILQPAMRRARDTAHAAVCASNMRGAGIALLAYAADHNLATPPSSSSADSSSWGWCLFKAGYAPIPSALACIDVLPALSGEELTKLGPVGNLGNWDARKGPFVGVNARNQDVFGLAQGTPADDGFHDPIVLRSTRVNSKFFLLTEVLRLTVPHVDFSMADRYHVVYLRHFDRATTFYADGSCRATAADYFLHDVTSWGKPTGDAVIYGRTSTIRNYDTK